MFFHDDLSAERNPVIRCLVVLADEYQHLQQEQERIARRSDSCYAFAQRMERIAERFAQLPTHWKHDVETRSDWMRFLRAGGPMPELRFEVRPPDFVGVDQNASRVEVRKSEDGRAEVLVDDRVESRDLRSWVASESPDGCVAVGLHVCHEVFEAPRGALLELAAFFKAPQNEPPWHWAWELHADGLVDEGFSLTARGHRALNRRPALTQLIYGVLVANTASARLFSLPASHAHTPVFHPMTVVTDLSGADDAQGFAARIVLEATRRWRAQGVNRTVVTAGPTMLNRLRAEFDRLPSTSRRWLIHELELDLTRLDSLALHDVLAANEALPPRGHLLPLKSSPLATHGSS